MSALLTGNLPLIADAPDGIRKLRGLILELAVRGKLVPQNPKDEPASELLKRIAKMRVQPEASGLVKSLLPSTPVVHTDPDFDLPVGWEWIRLTHLGEFRGGKTPSTNRPDYWGGSIPWVSPKDMKPSVIEATEDYVTDLAINHGLALIPASSVLIVVRSGILRRMVPVAITGQSCTVNQDIKALCLIEANMARYVQLLIRGFERLILATLTKVGTTVESIKFDEFLKQSFPLPPLAEQHRIVAKVDELMALCDRLEAEQADTEAAHAYLVETVLAALTRSADAADFAANWQRLAAHFDTLFTTEAAIDALKQTVLQLAVTGKLVPQDPTDEPASELLKRIAEMREERLASGYPNINEAATQLRKQQEQSCPSGLARLPEGWSWATLMQSAELVVDCHNKTAPYSSSGIPLLRTTNIRNGSLNLREPKFVTNETYERWSARCKPQSGDLLITREAPMGEACIIPEGMTVCMGQRMMLIRLVPETIHPQFLLHTLLAPDMMERVQDKPVGATVEHLRVGGVETLLVAIPPLAEQNRIVAKVNELITLCDRLKADLATARQRQATLADTLIAAALEAA